jgi:hypothetical protein
MPIHRRTRPALRWHRAKARPGLRPADRAHAAPATAAGGLDDHRIAQGLGQCFGIFGGRQRRGRSGHHRNIEALGKCARLDLVAEQPERLGRGADEAQSLVAAALGEGRVLGEEPVARMHTIAAAAPGRIENRVDVEVGPHRIGGLGQMGANLERPGGELGMQRQRVDGRVHGDRLDAQRRGGPGDADGDLAAIGDQYSIEHEVSWMRLGCGAPRSGRARESKVVGRELRTPMISRDPRSRPGPCRGRYFNRLGDRPCMKETKPRASKSSRRVSTGNSCRPSREPDGRLPARPVPA